ncbi:MAG: flavin reductase [bacterium]
MDKKAMYTLTYGLFVVTACQDGKHNGCITNTVGQVTTKPNQISVAINKGNLTHDMVLSTGLLTVSVISEEADFSLFRRFGFQSGRDADKFAGYGDAWPTENGTKFVTTGTNAYLSARVVQALDLGTHTMFICEVTDMETLSEAPSCTYAYYLSHIKPQPEKKEAPTGKTVWRCKICGYEYEGDQLPPDFVCPLCKHGAEDFEKVQ